MGDRGVPLGRIGKSFREMVGPTLGIIRFLLLVMLPVSFAVLVLEASGLLFYVAKFMDPLMRFLGLPGEAALAFISSVFINIYSAIAVIRTITLSGKQLIILCTMCMVAHNFFVECIVMKKTGSRLFRIVILRLTVSLAAAWALNHIVPAGTGSPEPGTLVSQWGPPSVSISLDAAIIFSAFRRWLAESVKLILQIFLIVFAVMFLQRLLSEFGITKFLGRVMNPLMRFIGLPENSGYAWIITTTVGVAYGAGILIEEAKEGRLSRSDSDLINHHAAINHSQIEDTLLFVSIGVPYIWAALPRFILAIIVVWVERIRRAVFRRSFRVKVM